MSAIGTISVDTLNNKDFGTGDAFLFQQHEFEDARKVLRHALDAPADPDRPVWDAGRRAEVRSLLEQIDQKLASNR